MDCVEVVVAAYSGKVVSFTSEPVLQRAQVLPHSHCTDIGFTRMVFIGGYIW